MDPNCKRFTETDEFCIKCKNVDICETDVFVTVSIINFKVICTCEGNKLIINGLKHIELVFPSEKCCKNERCEKFEIPFQQVILLTNTCDSVKCISACIENISAVDISCDCIIVTTTILLCPIFKKCHKNMDYHIPCDKNDCDNYNKNRNHKSSSFYGNKNVYIKWTYEKED